jgi:hypothetical protein
MTFVLIPGAGGEGSYRHLVAVFDAPRVVRVVDNAAVSNGRGEGKTRRRLVGIGLGTALLGAAVATELRKPAGERTWHGSIGRKIPYDLRPPTVARVRERLWNPADRRILVPTVFGVGWTVNLGRLFSTRVA